MQAEAMTIADQALAWHLKVPDMGEAEWETFLAWLEAAPANRAAYDEVAEADGLLGLVLAGGSVPAHPVHRPAPEPAEDFGAVRAGPWRRHRRVLGWAASGIAACLAVVGAWSFMGADPRLTVEQTAPGTIKELAFAEGTRVQLNGDSAVELDPRGSRRARLLRGEALFTVRHQPQAFEVEAGGFRIRDLGTVFNVQLGERTLDLAVREGSVEFDPEGVALVVHAGEAITINRDNGLVLRHAAAGVGGWVTGELVFADTPLAQVAAAVARREGVTIVLSEGLSDRSFTGNIRLSGDGAADAAHLAALIGVAIRRDGDRWLLG